MPRYTDMEVRNAILEVLRQHDGYNILSKQLEDELPEGVETAQVDAQLTYLEQEGVITVGTDGPWCTFNSQSSTK